MELKVWETRRKRKKRGQWKRRWKENGAEAGDLEKPQVLRGLIDGKNGSVVVDLPNLGVQLVFILTEMCFHCTGFFGLEIYLNKMAPNILIRTKLT